MDCNCPAPTALTAIPSQDCGVNLKQIQRIAFRRVGNQIGAAAQPAANDILELADWQALMALADSGKVVVSPLIGANPTIDAGDKITDGGGDNSTLNGIEEVEGVNPSEFNAEFKELSPEIEKAMKQLMCEKNLEVFLFLEGGRIASIKIDADNYKGLPIQSFFFSDRSNQGFGTKDRHTMYFSLPSGWSEELDIVKPNFNPLTEL